ncbi:unnamed protein product [Prorocentrum cordatum]|uniref:Uncharacterized protein n=1 Tax=Prorocentrum cordatum TaxID=2364126 RepID=A0ABN9U9C2_9DINO|nr:unnamed protein product [Polarella glacialis]
MEARGPAPPWGGGGAAQRAALECVAEAREAEGGASRAAAGGAEVEELLAALGVASDGSHRTEHQEAHVEEAVATDGIGGGGAAATAPWAGEFDQNSQEVQEQELCEQAPDADFKSTTDGEASKEAQVQEFLDSLLEASAAKDSAAIKVVDSGTEAESAEPDVAEACALLAVLVERLTETDTNSFHEFWKLFGEAPTAVQQASWQEMFEGIRCHAVECEPLVRYTRPRGIGITGHSSSCWCSSCLDKQIEDAERRIRRRAACTKEADVMKQVTEVGVG